MYEDIKVSVITPTYNDERFIKETLLSILNQTHSNLEILVVDDCSTDSTVEIIKSINDDRIKLFVNDKNQGAAYSRNLAISKATGEYIAFLDGDDCWESNKLEKQLEFMITNDFCFSCTFYKEIDEEGRETGFYIKAPKIITHKKLMRTNYIGCLTVMFKRSIFPDLQIPPSILKRNDYALWLKLSEREPCHTFNENLAFYRKRTESISSGKKNRLIKHHFNLFTTLYGFGPIVSAFYAFRNVIFFFIRRIIYRKRCLGDVKC